VLSRTCLLLLETDSGSLLNIEVYRFLPGLSCCLQAGLVVPQGKAPVTEPHNKGPPARQEAQLLKVQIRGLGNSAGLNIVELNSVKVC
jgi:hypothetical protein